MAVFLVLLSFNVCGIAFANNEQYVQDYISRQVSFRAALDNGYEIEPQVLQQITPTPDRDGLISDTKYFFLYQIFFVGVLYAAPEGVSGWSDESKDKDRIQSYKDNVSEVVWDEDAWEVNYIGHPYFGAAYYIRARERGYDEQASFWYSAALSASYEFGVEALFENPSFQDLFVTPILGTALGFYFESVRANIRQRQLQSGKLSGTDKFLLGFTDPLGFLNQYADKLFKSNVEFDIVPFVTYPSHTQRENGSGSSTFGLVLNVKW